MTDFLVNEVVEAIADAEGIAPREVDPLHDYIDPEILTKLAEQETDGDCRVVFRYADHQVTVTDDSRVFVDGGAHAADSITNE